MNLYGSVPHKVRWSQRAPVERDFLERLQDKGLVTADGEIVPVCRWCGELDHASAAEAAECKAVYLLNLPASAPAGVLLPDNGVRCPRCVPGSHCVHVVESAPAGLNLK